MNNTKYTHNNWKCIRWSVVSLNSSLLPSSLFSLISYIMTPSPPPPSPLSSYLDGECLVDEVGTVQEKDEFLDRHVRLLYHPHLLLAVLVKQPFKLIDKR